MSRICKAWRDCPTERLNAESCIRRALELFPDVCVSWSGGKCSTVALFIALKVDPNIHVVFNDTGIEFPETYAFVEDLSQKWSLNLTVLKPKVNFWRDIVPKYGFPMLRGQYKDDSRSKDGRPMCCQLLKEQPLRDAGIKWTITGIRVAESRMRMFGIAQKGQFYYAKTLKRWNFHPLAFWSTDRLNRFIKDQQIPLNSIYSKGHLRCGCWCCTGYLTWRESLRQSHPKLYRFLMKQKGEPTLWEYLDNETCVQTALEA